MRSVRAPEEQILLWCGVIAQLQRTRTNQILKEAELPYSLFVLLRHFCHDPDREWTVGQLTAAFETEQPGMTKQVQKLLALSLIESRSDEDDRRRRWLRVTAKGVRLRDELVAQIEPDRRQVFTGWKRSEIRQLHDQLDRLRRYLDDHRDNVIVPEKALKKARKAAR